MEYKGVCPEHSGLVVAIDTLKESVKDGFEKMFEKIDAIDTKVSAQTISIATDQIENKWKHRTTALGWGVAGGGGVMGILKALGTWFNK